MGKIVDSKLSDEELFNRYFRGRVYHRHKEDGMSCYFRFDDFDNIIQDWSCATVDLKRKFTRYDGEPVRDEDVEKFKMVDLKISGVCGFLPVHRKVKYIEAPKPVNL